MISDETTHYEGCYTLHHGCAVAKVRELTIERGDAAAEVLRLREAIRWHRNETAHDGDATDEALWEVLDE